MGTDKQYAESVLQEEYERQRYERLVQECMAKMRLDLNLPRPNAQSTPTGESQAHNNVQPPAATEAGHFDLNLDENSTNNQGSVSSSNGSPPRLDQIERSVSEVSLQPNPPSSSAAENHASATITDRQIAPMSPQPSLRNGNGFGRGLRDLVDPKADEHRKLRAEQRRRLKQDLDTQVSLHKQNKLLQEQKTLEEERRTARDSYKHQRLFPAEQDPETAKARERRKQERYKEQLEAQMKEKKEREERNKRIEELEDEKFARQLQQSENRYLNSEEVHSSPQNKQVGRSLAMDRNVFDDSRQDAWDDHRGPSTSPWYPKHVTPGSPNAFESSRWRQQGTLETDDSNRPGTYHQVRDQSSSPNAFESSRWRQQEALETDSIRPGTYQQDRDQTASTMDVPPPPPNPTQEATELYPGYPVYDDHQFRDKLAAEDAEWNREKEMNWQHLQGLRERFQPPPNEYFGNSPPNFQGNMPYVSPRNLDGPDSWNGASKQVPTGAQPSQWSYPRAGYKDGRDVPRGNPVTSPIHMPPESTNYFGPMSGSLEGSLKSDSKLVDPCASPLEHFAQREAFASDGYPTLPAQADGYMGHFAPLSDENAEYESYSNRLDRNDESAHTSHMGYAVGSQQPPADGEPAYSISDRSIRSGYGDDDIGVSMEKSLPGEKLFIFTPSAGRRVEEDINQSIAARNALRRAQEALPPVDISTDHYDVMESTDYTEFDSASTSLNSSTAASVRHRRRSGRRARDRSCSTRGTSVHDADDEEGPDDESERYLDSKGPSAHEEDYEEDFESEPGSTATSGRAESKRRSSRRGRRRSSSQHRRHRSRNGWKDIEVCSDSSGSEVSYTRRSTNTATTHEDQEWNQLQLAAKQRGWNAGEPFEDEDGVLADQKGGDVFKVHHTVQSEVEQSRYQATPGRQSVNTSLSGMGQSVH